jgi:hypothetical protein
MPAYEYLTDVITHGLMGRQRDEINRGELEQRLNEHGAEGWELEKLLTDVALHGERDGHLLILRRAAG